ncbi:hypothetical protein [uncultured Faecalibaculum sp.]|uniref:hypothetical protein n=1 Tax=uncultured Faecalibaculum sp. TaxID=1729681 RepID=UPI0025FC4856|nr:hypothetical protein [uncultured Faecalibaculum sp.]
MSQSKRDDRLDALLDSLSQDTELERKMDAFSHTREEEKAGTGPVLSARDNREPDTEDEGDIPDFASGFSGDTIVTDRPVVQEPEEAGGTMVFAPKEIEDTASSPESTVVLDNGEIDSLIEEEKGPSLKRERVSRSGGRQKEHKKTDWRAAGIIAAVIAVIALGALLIFGISHVMQSMTADKTEEKDTQADFDALKTWAQGLSGTSGTGIKNYESRWNRLTDKQKREINEILRDRTGKSFDEILAEEKAGEKADKDNNNTEVAEQKARLKDQIAQLQSQLASAQAEYDSAQGKINDAQSRVDSANAALADAQNTYGSAQQSVNDLSAQIKSLELSMDDINAQLDEEESPMTPKAQELMAKMNELKGQKSSLESQLSTAQSQMDQASGVIQARENDLASAQGALDALAGSTDSAQSRIDDLNSQIAALQSQLDALN